MIRVARLDHLVLTVASIEASLAFYAGVLGLEVVTFGAGRKALRFGAQQINLHQADGTFEPKATHPLPGSADLCFIVETEIADVATHLLAHGIATELGPVPREGASGSFLSLYLRDPDGNLVELSQISTRS